MSFGNFYNRPQVHTNPHAETDAVLRKILSRGPVRPANLMKRTAPDVEVNRVNDMALTKAERDARSHAAEALDVIKGILAKGPRRALPMGTALEKSAVPRGLGMLHKAHKHPATLSPNGQLPVDIDVNPRDLAYYVHNGQVVRKALSAAAWNRMSWSERRAAMRKVLPPEDADTSDRSAMPRTGARNDWHDETFDGDEPQPTRLAYAAVGTPSKTNYEAAIEAVKADLRKPKTLRFGGIKAAQRADLDEEEEDECREDDRNPNASDAFDTDPNSMRRRRRGKAGM